MCCRWESYAVATNHSTGLTTANKWFDSYSTVAADMASYSSDVVPSCLPGGAELDAVLTPKGFTCSEGWYFSSSCADDKASCIPVVLATFDWNGLSYIEMAEKYGCACSRSRPLDPCSALPLPAPTLRTQTSLMDRYLTLRRPCTV